VTLEAPVVLAAATGLEAGALRRALPGAHVVQTGIALAQSGPRLGPVVLSCGLAGGLREDVPTGTLLLPREVRRPGGDLLHCDEELVEALARGAARLGLLPLFDPLFTADAIVRGAERARWAAQGYAGVDMETGRLEGERIAAVRVVLDTPRRELHADWLHPLRAFLELRNWPEALWLFREAPPAARLAARVVAESGITAARSV